MNGIRKIQELSQQELDNNISGSASWHAQYSDTSFIYIGGLPFELKEEDIISIFSQYGVPTFIKLVRDKETGESKGFCFLEYENQQSTILLVDNFNGIKLLGRTIKVDHCYYKPFTSDDPEDMEKERQYQERMKELLSDNVTENEPQKLVEGTVNLIEDDDLADPMADYINNKNREHKSHSNSRKERDHHKSRDRSRDKHHHRHHRKHHTSSSHEKSTSPVRGDPNYRSSRD